MLSDFLFILYWWILLFGIGVVFLPLTFLIFENFFDKGYVFSKILGILIISYLTWLLGSLRILPFTNSTIWLLIFFSVSLNYYLLLKSKNSKVKNKNLKFKILLSKKWKIFVFEEILFLSTLAFWSFIRGFQPSIQGLEKFMDYGFVNSILRSKYFPPVDMWLAGETINYYYFGHLVSAVLTKLSEIDSAITYNLMMATLFAFTFTGAFCFGANLVSNLKFKILNFKLVTTGGIMTAFLLSLGSNLHPLWYFLKNSSYKGYWYPDATRFIVQIFGAKDNTIHEFPAYSFVVADLHGHLLNLPFVILFLSLMLSFVIDINKDWKLRNENLIISSLLLGTFYVTNTWDFAIYNLVFGGLILLFNYLRYKFALLTILDTARIVFPVFIGSFLFSLPFHIKFKSLVGGIAFADFHSPLWMLLVLWGFPLFIFLSFLLFIKLKKDELLIADYFILLIWGVSWFLIIFPEFFYIKDIYTHSYQRANTMFKLTYQSFVMFYLTSFYIIFKIIISLKKGILKFLFLNLNFIFLIFILGIYPYFAIKSYYGLKIYRGLYGLDFLRRNYSDDYQAILWLKKNIHGQPVIVEAVGESYTDFARVSVNTGLPTILGWRVHEWLWRGSFDEPGKRTGEVQEIYESRDLRRTKMLLDKYNAEYVFIGTLERQQYPNLNEEKFENLGKLVFVSGNTKIYKIDR
ncbi:MAG: DUF2298 domain-containing protein [Microgenomates group bacterium]